MALDMIFTSNAAASAADFTVEVYPALGSVLPGQNVQIRIISTSGTGHADPFESLFFDFDFDDPGATADYAPDTLFPDANKGFGRVSSKAWETPGLKSIIITMYDISGALRSKTVDITVRDPAQEPWTDEYYVDFGEVSGAPNFSGAPAAGPNIHHVTSWAQLAAVATQWGENSRIVFKRGETFTVDTNDDFRLRGSNYLTGKVESFSTADADPIIRSGLGNNARHSVFRPDGSFYADDSLWFNHSVFYGLDFRGSYDPVLFGAPSGAMTPIQCEHPNEGETIHVSMFKCSARGCDSVVLTIGPTNEGGHKVILATNCDISDWYDYAFELFGGTSSVSVENCRIRQNPYAVPWDEKNGINGSPDHGCLRIHAADWVSFTNNSGGNSSGWFNLGGDTRSIQPIIRLYQNSGDPNRHPPEVIASILFNNFGGSNFIDLGVNTTAEPNPVGEARIFIDGNRFIGGRESTLGVIRNNGMTGLYIRNNLFRRANVFGGYSTVNFFLGLVGTRMTNDLAGTQTRPIVLEGNTLISQRTAESGENGPVNVYRLFEEFQPWTGTLPIERDNIVQADGHENAASFPNYNPLDPAVEFRPVVGSSAIGTATSERQRYRDGADAVITVPANIGAFDSQSSVAGTVPAPVNTVPPTIAEHPRVPGHYYVSDFGVWQNLEPTDEFSFAYEWQVNGQDVPFRKYVALHRPSSSAPGALTCNLVATNASGQRVIAGSSNSILVP